MALNLKKATSTTPVAPLNLTKSAKHLLTGLKMGLSWDGDADLDAVAIVKKDGKLLGGSMQTSLVAYPMHENDEAGNRIGDNWIINGVTYSGDATNGAADGFDEEIEFNLNNVEGDEIILYLTSYVEEGSEPLTFGAADNPKVSLCDCKNKQLADISLDADAAFGTAFSLARIFLEDGAWKVTNVNEMVGSSCNGLQDVLDLHQ